jgi:uncharacterized membrane protein YbhN (UPF0104 family)
VVLHPRIFGALLRWSAHLMHRRVPLPSQWERLGEGTLSAHRSRLDLERVALTPASPAAVKIEFSSPGGDPKGSRVTAAGEGQTNSSQPTALFRRAVLADLRESAYIGGPSFPEPPAYPVTLSLLALYVGVWLVAALALFATLRAVSPVSAEKLPAVVGAWGIAFLSGYVAPLLPAGLGVREATASALLSSIVPLPIAVAAAVLFRLLLTIAEAVCLAPFVFGLRAMIRPRSAADNRL